LTALNDGSILPSSTALRTAAEALYTVAKKEVRAVTAHLGNSAPKVEEEHGACNAAF